MDFSNPFPKIARVRGRSLGFETSPRQVYSATSTCRRREGQTNDTAFLLFSSGSDSLNLHGRIRVSHGSLWREHHEVIAQAPAAIASIRLRPSRPHMS
jgi:hypothetical protein